MAPLVGPHDERYAEFYLNWMDTQESMLKELQEALDSDMKEPELSQLVKKIAGHYEEYYKAKRSACHQDILQTLTPDWRSSLEKAFLWLGGWRPSLAFQLVYALAGQQIEAELAELLDGVDTPTLASVTSAQLSQINDLQTATYKEEENLSNEMAVLQQSLADQPLVTLAQVNRLLQAEDRQRDKQMAAHDEGEPAPGAGGHHHSGHSTGSSSREDSGSGEDGGNGDDDSDNLDTALQEKLIALEDIAAKADMLRLVTLQKVVGILDTYQKAQYLEAAGRLQIAVRNIGQKLKEHAES